VVVTKEGFSEIHSSGHETHQQCCALEGSDAVLGARWARVSLSTRCEILDRRQKSLRTCIIKCNL